MYTKEPIWSCIAGCLVVSNTAWLHLSLERLLLSQFVMELYLLNRGFTALPPSPFSSFRALVLWQHRERRKANRKKA